MRAVLISVRCRDEGGNKRNCCRCARDRFDTIASPLEVFIFIRYRLYLEAAIAANNSSLCLSIESDMNCIITGEIDILNKQSGAAEKFPRRFNSISCISLSNYRSLYGYDYNHAKIYVNVGLCVT